MGTRTLQEIQTEAARAIDRNDAAALFTYAEELSRLGHPLAQASADICMGWANYLRGKFDDALENYQHALAVFEEANVPEGIASVRMNLGNLQQSQGLYPEALENMHKALEFVQSLGETNRLSSIYTNIGIVHYTTGSFPLALEYWQRAMAIHQEMGDKNGVAGATCNIGNIYADTGHPDKALEMYHRALALHEEVGNRYHMAHDLTGIGNAYQVSGEFEKAQTYYDRAQALYTDLGYPHHVLDILTSLVKMKLDQGLNDEARVILAQLDATEIIDPTQRNGRERSRARLQIVDGLPDLARETLKRALVDAAEHGLPLKEAETHKDLRDLALSMNDLAAYVEHNNEFTRLTEEFNGKETATKLAMQIKQREMEEVQREHQKQLAVLHSALPAHIADRVAKGEVVHDSFESAAVIFLDIVGFTTISDKIPSGHVVYLLEQIFITLDEVCEKNNVVKIKTIGDSYMAVSFEDVSNAAQCALDMVEALDTLQITMPPELGDTSWTKDVGSINVRVGMHCGPVTAGVIGTQRMQYDVWGDTVNVASRMESNSLPGRVNVSSDFAAALQGDDRFTFELRGSMDVKGKGAMEMFFLGRA